MNDRVALIGAGRAGSTVARALDLGNAVVVAVINRTVRTARALAGELGATTASASVADIPVTTTLIIIGAPDAQIASVVGELAACALPWKKITVAHLSGALTRDVLAPLARRGAKTMALHPAFPFASRDVALVRLDGIGWGIDCADRDVTAAKKLVRSMKGVPVRVPSRSRIAYHAACAIISNYTVTLAETAMQVAQQAGLAQRDAAQVLYPLLAATVENIVMSDGAPIGARLTGPIARADAALLAQHINALKSNKDAGALYKALGAQTVRLLGARAAGSRALLKIFR